MRPLPASLPPPDSPKWRSRRLWDALGYLRVRSLSNPAWRRDIDRLVRVLRSQEPSPHIDDAIRAARRYRSAAPGEEQDRAWDAVLEPIDRFLELRQAQHLRAGGGGGLFGTTGS